MVERNKDIFSNIINLDHFTKSLRDKFDIIDVAYKALSIYFDENPIGLKQDRIMNHYQLGKTFLDTFALTPLNEDESAMALNTIYTTIGITEVIERIANFTGFKVKVTPSEEGDHKLSITIISEAIFDINLFEIKLNEFIADVLLFQNLVIEFELIVSVIHLEYGKKMYSIVELSNTLPIKVEKILDLE